MRPAAAALALSAVAALAGCGGVPSDRPPPPIERIDITPRGFVLDGEGMDERRMKAELSAYADRHRDQSGAARVIVRLTVEQGVDYDRVRDLQDWLVSVGLVQIEQDH